MKQFRNQPIDRRRMTMEQREVYRPSSRANALSLAKSYQAYNSYYENKPPFTSTLTAGTGGFTPGIETQQQRFIDKAAEQRRAESFRPETELPF